MPDQTHLLYGWLITVGSCALIGAIIGFDKGKAGPGFFYGLFLGPLGLFFAALAEDERLQCAVCRELISPMVKTCPKCGASMAKLSLDAVSHDTGSMLPAPGSEPPRVIPSVPRIAGTPRVVAKMSKALSKVTRALGQVPDYFIRKPAQIVRAIPRDLPTMPIMPKPQGPRVVRPGPPVDIPQVSRAAAKVSKFFIFKPGDDEARGPFDLAQIQALVECGVITGETKFCREGENEWRDSFTV